MKFSGMNQTYQSSGFPVLLECISSDDRYKGQYHLIPENPLLVNCFSAKPSSRSLLIYQKAGVENMFLGYCEGVPELLPADIWQTVVAESLSRHAEANMSAAVATDVSPVVAMNVCEEMIRIALEVSKELVGWLLFTVDKEAMTPVARCVQRIPEAELREDSVRGNPPGVAQCPESSWEMMKPSNLGKRPAPSWISEKLSPCWCILATQSGRFRTDPSFTVRQVTETPLLTRPIPFIPDISNESDVHESFLTSKKGDSPAQLKWNLRDVSSELASWIDFGGLGIVSRVFTIRSEGLSFAIELHPWKGPGLISVTLARFDESKKAFRFRVSLGGSSSGNKLLESTSSRFTVLMDPRLVFGTRSAPGLSERIELLKQCAVLIEFIDLRKST